MYIAHKKLAIFLLTVSRYSAVVRTLCCVVALLRGLKATVVAGYPLHLLDDVAAKKMAGVWPMDSS